MTARSFRRMIARRPASLAPRVAALLLVPCLAVDPALLAGLASARAEHSPVHLSFEQQAVVQPLLDVLFYNAGRAKAAMIRTKPGRVEVSIPAAPQAAAIRGDDELPPQDPTRKDLIEMLVAGNVGGAEGTLDYLLQGLPHRKRLQKMKAYGKRVTRVRALGIGDVVAVWTGLQPPRLGWLHKIEGNRMVVSPWSDGGPWTAWTFSEPGRIYFQLTTRYEMDRVRRGLSGDRILACMSGLKGDWKSDSTANDGFRKTHPAGAAVTLQKSGNWEFSLDGFPSAPSPPALKVRRFRSTRRVEITLSGSRNAVPFEISDADFIGVKVSGQRTLRMVFTLSSKAMEELRARGFTAWEGTSWNGEVQWEFQADPRGKSSIRGMAQSLFDPWKKTQADENREKYEAYTLFKAPWWETSVLVMCAIVLGAEWGCLAFAGLHTVLGWIYLVNHPERPPTSWPAFFVSQFAELLARWFGAILLLLPFQIFPLAAPRGPPNLMHLVLFIEAYVLSAGLHSLWNILFAAHDSPLRGFLPALSLLSDPSLRSGSAHPSQESLRARCA